MENMVHMFGGTKKKSTLVDESIIVYVFSLIIFSILSQSTNIFLLIWLLYDIGSQEKMKAHQDKTSLPGSAMSKIKLWSCMAANDFLEANCLESKGILDKCASKAFKQVNADENYKFWISRTLAIRQVVK